MFAKISCKMIKYLAFLLLMFSSCEIYAQEENNYFKLLETEINKTNNLNIKYKIAEREKSLFEKKHDTLYFLSYKLAILNYYSCKKDEAQQLKTSIELLNYNIEKDITINSIANFNVATQLENYLPEVSENYLNAAIKSENISKEKKLLPHLYHFKGKLFYNKKKYDSAKYYFQKALTNYKPNELLFKASMYNNLGLVAEKLNQDEKAKQYYNKGIIILENKMSPSLEEKRFLQTIQINYGDIFFNNLDYSSAQNHWEKLFYVIKDKTEYLRNSIIIATNLYIVYDRTHNDKGIEKIIIFIKKHEVNNEALDVNKYILEMLQDFAYKKNNLTDIKKYSEKLIKFKDKTIEENEKFISKTSNALFKNIIESANEKYYFILQRQKKKFNWYLTIGALALIILILGFTVIINRLEIIKKQYKIDQQNKIIIEKDNKIKEEKIRTLHININLKNESEKIFLEKIKKARRSGTKKTEELLKELHLQLNNLINIDKSFKKDNESTIQNENFINNLTSKFPELNDLEVQLCTYFSIYMTAKEIAIIEKLGVPSVRVYKSRIKAKLGLSREDSLEDFLNKI